MGATPAKSQRRWWINLGLSRLLMQHSCALTRPFQIDAGRPRWVLRLPAMPLLFVRPLAQALPMAIRVLRLRATSPVRTTSLCLLPIGPYDEPSGQVYVGDGADDSVSDLFGAFEAEDASLVAAADQEAFDEAEDASLVAAADQELFERQSWNIGIKIPESAARVHAWAKGMGAPPVAHRSRLCMLSDRGLGPDPDIHLRPKIPWDLLGDRRFFAREAEMVIPNPF